MSFTALIGAMLRLLQAPLAMVQTAQNLARHMGRVPFLLLLFFGGGAARLISNIMTGPPHALFVLLMGVELMLPVVLGVCFLRVRKT